MQRLSDAISQHRATLVMLVALYLYSAGHKFIPYDNVLGFLSVEGLSSMTLVAGVRDRYDEKQIREEPEGSVDNKRE
jgi:hypothetical protein